eukprot:Platyproteum_vivax@DN3088_c0_g1_i1.p2
MGKPRRLSNSLLLQERTRLVHFSKAVRMLINGHNINPLHAYMKHCLKVYPDNSSTPTQEPLSVEVVRNDGQNIFDPVQPPAFQQVSGTQGVVSRQPSNGTIRCRGLEDVYTAPIMHDSKTNVNMEVLSLAIAQQERVREFVHLLQSMNKNYQNTLYLDAQWLANYGWVLTQLRHQAIQCNNTFRKIFTLPFFETKI